MLYGIALDLGYGYTKGVNQDNDRFITPSLVGSGRKMYLGEIFGSGDDNNDLYVRLESGGRSAEYFVGDLARRESRDASQAFDSNKVFHPHTQVLLATAAARLMPKDQRKVHLVSGLPLEEYYRQKDAFQQHLENFQAKVTFIKNDKDVYSKEIKFDEVTIFPQGAGAVYHAFKKHRGYFQKGYLIGLVDVGTKTTDVIVFEVADRFIIRHQLSATFEIGTSTLYQEILSKSSEMVGSTLESNKIPIIMENMKAFYHRGQDYDLSGIVEQARNNIALSIKDKLTALWGSDIDCFRVVFLGGGGSGELNTGLRGIHPTTVLLEDCQFANAYGFMVVHSMVTKRLITPTERDSVISKAI
ncbi:MAG: ParM/StbA family protein [Firmicutes bacterium]|nr:ParM/StbA family protein [Bacillota bacterium]